MREYEEDRAHKGRTPLIEATVTGHWYNYIERKVSDIKYPTLKERKRVSV